MSARRQVTLIEREVWERLTRELGAGIGGGAFVEVLDDGTIGVGVVVGWEKE